MMQAKGVRVSAKDARHAIGAVILAACTVRALFLLALVGSVACSNSSDSGDGDGSSSSGPQGDCSCAVSVNGTPVAIACGASKCVDGTTYACDSSASSTKLGSCGDTPSSSRGSSGSDGGSSSSDSGSSGSDVCQALAYNCATCQASCGYIPITTGCKQNGCPSQAQICRTAEDPAGYCTHICKSDDDCPIAGGGNGSCSPVNSFKICIVD